MRKEIKILKEETLTKGVTQTNSLDVNKIKGDTMSNATTASPTTTLNVNNIIRDGVTENHDGVMSVTKFKLNENNIDMYGKYEQKHIENLQDSIIKDGLKNPIVLYSDGITIKSGHNRFFAIKGLGYTELPYVLSNESKPKSVLKEMISLAIENMGRPANMGRSFSSVKIMSEAFASENDGVQPKTSDVKGFCSYHQIGYESYTKLSALEQKHPDLFDRVIEGKQSLSSAWTDKTMRENGNGVTLNQTPFMNGLLGLKEINYGIGTVSAVRGQMESITINKPGGEMSPAFGEMQKNIMGGIVHEIFTNSIKDIVNYTTGKDTLTAPKNNGLYDLEAEMENSGIETKTCVTETGKKPKFVTHRYKNGYHVLLSITPNGNRAFAGYGVIPVECWRKGMPVGTLDINKLITVSTFNVLIGSLEEENGKVVVNHDNILVG